MIFELARDYSDALAAMPADHPKWRILSLLEEAVRRDVHFIERQAQDYPQGLFQCLWNHGWWYDCPEAAKHYKVPDGGWKSLPPWERPGLKLSKFLESWREEKGRVIAGLAWIRSLRPPPVALGCPLKAVLRGHAQAVESVAFSPDGRRIVSGAGTIVSGDTDNTVRIWDAESGAKLVVLCGHKHGVRSVAFSPDGRRIVSGAGGWGETEDCIRVWDAETGTELAVLRGHKHGVQSVAFSPDGQRIVSGSWDKTVRVWDAESGAELAVLRGHKRVVGSVAFSPDGRRIVSGGDNTVRLWDAESGAELAVLCGHETSVNSVAFSPDGERIVSGSYDDTLRLWDAESGAVLAVLRGHKGGVLSVAFSPDGRRIVSGSNDKTIRLWDAESGVELAVFRGHEGGYPQSVAFSPDGRRIVSGGDNTVRLWDAESREESAALRGHENNVRSVAFSPDGRRIVSGSDWHDYCDYTVQLWDTASGAELAALSGHTDAVESVALSVDGRRIASAGVATLFNTVRLWDAESGECVKVFRVLLGDIIVSSLVPKTASSPCSALVHADETVVQLEESRRVLARFPARLCDLATHPNGRIWAGDVRNHLYILTIEGWEPGASEGTARQKGSKQLAEGRVATQPPPAHHESLRDRLIGFCLAVFMIPACILVVSYLFFSNWVMWLSIFGVIAIAVVTATLLTLGRIKTHMGM